MDLQLILVVHHNRWEKIDYGVPQGSIFGCIILYIKNIIEEVQKFETYTRENPSHTKCALSGRVIRTSSISNHSIRFCRRRICGHMHVVHVRYLRKKPSPLTLYGT